MTFVLLASAVLAGPAAAASSMSSSSAGDAVPAREVKMTLVGPRQVVVRNLPAQAVDATREARTVSAPRRLPPESIAGPLSPVPAANAVDPALSAQSESNTPPSMSTANFDGLDNDDNGAIAGIITRPPDPQLAVGPDHVFEMVNVSGRIYSRTGAGVQSFSLRDFFQVPTNYSDTDPKVLYDALSGRWFASYVSILDLNGPNNDEGRLHLAISQTSDPTGAWNVYFLSYAQIFPDYAGVGVTNDKFTISSNVFSIDQPFYYGDQTIVIEKADVMAGVAGNQVGIFDFPFNLNRFTVRPVHSLSSVNDQYLVTRDSSSTLTVIRITGTPDQGNVTEAAATNLTIIAQDSPPASLTASSSSIDSGDYRILDAMWRNGSLWASASAACVPAGDASTRSCAHLIEVAATPPAAPSIAQDIMFGAAGEYYSWPAVRTDASGDLYVSLTHTNSTIFAEARAAGRLASEPPNTMSGSTLLAAGEGLTATDRWGDYLGAAVDPNFPECVWLVGQYGKDTSQADLWDWGTYIGATSYSGGCDGDNDGWTDAAETSIGTSATSACGIGAWPADLNDDTFVDITDIAMLSGSFGQSVPPAPARHDIAPDPPDGFVDITDIARMSGLFGMSCSP